MKKPITLLFVPFILVACKESVIVPKKVTISIESVSAEIHTDKQNEFIDTEDPMTLVKTLSNESNSKPLPIKITWKEENDINQKADKYKVTLENSDEILSYYTVDSSIDIYNLKIDTYYSYSITSFHSGKEYESELSTISISYKAPRNIFIEGVENVRDLGGWSLESGKTYLQGMIYRSAQFNYGGGYNTYVSAPTDSGIKELRETLKIRTDIDVRKTVAFCGQDEVNGITSSPLGKDINYVSCPMKYNSQNIFTNSDNVASIKTFFETLADINNYPIIFHCLRGTDRTGALSYLLGAMLGMKEKDLMLDYLFSNMAAIGNSVKDTTINGSSFFIQGIKNSAGSSFSEKAQNYLINTIGVTQSTIDSIINILTK